MSRTDPLPEPDVPAAIEIHAAPVLELHPHPLSAVTETTTSSPDALAVFAVGDTVNAHVGGGAGVGVGVGSGGAGVGLGVGDGAGVGVGVGEGGCGAPAAA